MNKTNAPIYTCKADVLHDIFWKTFNFTGRKKVVGYIIWKFQVTLCFCEAILSLVDLYVWKKCIWVLNTAEIF